MPRQLGEFWGSLSAPAYRARHTRGVEQVSELTASISKLSDTIGISDAIPRTLQDQLGVKDTNELAPYSLRMLGDLFPELDRAQLYDFGKAAGLSEFQISEPSEDSEMRAQSGDEFNNASILRTLPPYNPQVDSQGLINGACGAFSSCSLLEFCLARAGRLPRGARLSRTFMYIAGNLMESHPFSWLVGNSYGIMPDAAGRVIASMGYLYDSDLPYDPRHEYFREKDWNVQLQPHKDTRYKYTPAHYQKALGNRPGGLRITALHPLNPLDSVTGKIDAYLRRGYPSVYGFKVPADFSGNGTGVMPRRDGDIGKGHAVLIIGKMVNWSPGPGHPTTNWYIYRNSWDAGFGANHPLKQYQGQSCGMIAEHDVYWRHIQSLHLSWE